MLTAVKIFAIGPIKVIPQKKKVIRQFFQSFLKCSLPMSLSKNITKKIGHLACLREMTGQTYPLLPLRPLLVHFQAPHFTAHFSIAGSKYSFKVKIKKKLTGTKSRA